MAVKKSKKITKTTKTVKTAKTAKPIKKVVRKSRPTKKMHAFQIIKERSPFVAFKITQQTIYWGILVAYIVILSLWILGIQLDTLRIIDKVNAL